jgi:hypothetical protein
MLPTNRYFYCGVPSQDARKEAIAEAAAGVIKACGLDVGGSFPAFSPRDCEAASQRLGAIAASNIQAGLTRPTHLAADGRQASLAVTAAPAAALPTASLATTVGAIAAIGSAAQSPSLARLC